MQDDSTGTILNGAPRLLEIGSLNSQKFSPVDKYLIGDSVPMRILKELIEQVARTRSTALITGESGTGKELVARAIHSSSNRAWGPFQAVNCGALPETLLEDELFGHIKGSFTGAIADKKGLFTAANGGTIFLDELGEMSLAMQVRLLRVLQERKIRPLGSTCSKEVDIDVRVIAATNKNLKKEIDEGHFRQDLFFRLNVFELHVPPLRERVSDIPELAIHLLDKVAKNAELPCPASLSQEATAVLCKHAWPGNVRELENILERLSISAGASGTILAEQVYTALNIERVDPPRSLDRTAFQCKLNDMNIVREELEFYEHVFRSVNGSFSEAARRLKLNRTTFRYRFLRLRNRLNEIE